MLALRELGVAVDDLRNYLVVQEGQWLGINYPP